MYSSDTESNGGSEMPVVPGGISPGMRALLILIFTSAALFGAAILSFSFVAPATQSIRALNWAATPCLILGSEITEEEIRGRAVYGLEILYQYEFEGARYVSSNYGFFDRRSEDFREMERIIARYPPLSEKICFVNPKMPDESALYRGLPSGLERFWFTGTGLLLFGAAGLFWGFQAVKRGRKQKERPFITPGITPEDERDGGSVPGDPGRDRL